MTILKNLFAAAVATVAFSAAANATVITFEEPNALTANGLSMSGMHLLRCSTYFTQDTGYCRGLASGDTLVYVINGSVTKSGGGVFDFNGANLTAAWNDNLQVNLVGYKSNVVLYQQTRVVSDDVTTYFNFNYKNIDRLVIQSYGGTDAGTPGGGTHLALDNFTFNESAVPEPGSIVLLGLGLAGLVAARRRKPA